MDLSNLATVITPNILYAKSKNPIDDQNPLAVATILSLLTNWTDFLEVPKEILDLMDSGEDLDWDDLEDKKLILTLKKSASDKSIKNE